MDLVDKVVHTLKEGALINKADRVLLGASGGMDSTALFHVLIEIAKRMRFELGVAHLNHMLRGKESQRDEAFVKRLAKKHGLPFYAKRVHVREYAKKEGLSLQHAGRDARYDFFKEISRIHGFNRIAVAHTMDDQIETFILRLIKGAGIKGLSSIPVRRENIVRPFLNIPRSEIEEYVRTHSISYVEDSSNAKLAYERNFVRKKILPVMVKLNSDARDMIFNLIQDLRTISGHFEKKAQRFIIEEVESAGAAFSVNKEKFKELDGEIQFRVITSLCFELEPSFVPLREHVKLVKKIIDGRRPNLSVQLPKKIKVKKIYDRLIFAKEVPAFPIKEMFAVGVGENTLHVLRKKLTIRVLEGKGFRFSEDENAAHFDNDKIGKLRVRTFREGDRFFPLGMKDSVKLKDFFISRKIPREERRHIPLLLSNDDIIWIIGYRIDERYKVGHDTRSIMEVMVFPMEYTSYSHS